MTINDPRDQPEYQVGGKKYQAPAERLAKSGEVDAQTVEQFHKKADTDSSQTAIHHTLGPRNGQAAPGDHNHNGANSVKLLAGTTITGSRGGNAAVASIIAALVKLGATDATTA
jgi:hypothetical protein